MNNKRIEYYGTLSPRNWEMFWSSTIGPNVDEGCACISIAEKWRSCIVEKLFLGRGQCVIFQDGDVICGFLNVYAPNHPSTRAKFWKDILNPLPVVEHWCVTGDFNMLEVKVIDRFYISHMFSQKGGITKIMPRTSF